MGTKRMTPKNKTKTNTEVSSMTDAPTVETPAEESAEFVELNVASDEQGFPCLTLEQLYAFNVGSLEAELAKTRRELALVARQLWLEQQAAYRKLTADIEATTTAHEARSKELRTIVADLSEQLGFKLEGCSVNDKTGRITFVDKKDRPMVGRATPPDHARLPKKT